MFECGQNVDNFFKGGYFKICWDLSFRDFKQFVKKNKKNYRNSLYYKEL